MPQSINEFKRLARETAPIPACLACTHVAPRMPLQGRSDGDPFCMPVPSTGAILSNQHPPCRTGVPLYALQCRTVTSGHVKSAADWSVSRFVCVFLTADSSRPLMIAASFFFFFLFFLSIECRRNRHDGLYILPRYLKQKLDLESVLDSWLLLVMQPQKDFPRVLFLSPIMREIWTAKPFPTCNQFRPASQRPLPAHLTAFVHAGGSTHKA